jgi:hypothetical protein
MATNLQTFSGEVEIPEGNLQLKRILELSGNNASTSNTGILFSRNLGSTSNSNVIVYFDEATESLRFGHTLNASSDSEIIMDSANVLNVNVFGEVEASYFKGDGGLLSNLVTDLQSVTENGAETDQTLVLTNAVTGIDVQTGNVNVAGNVTASIFFGDGGLLSNITQTLQGITEIGNTTSIALEFNNVTTGFVTTSNVGIVNTSPQHNFSVGSNLYVHDTDSNVLTVEGNVSAHKLTLGTIEITPAYGLENVTNISNLAYDTLLFQNTTTAFVTTAMAGIGLEPDSSDVGASGLHVDGHLRLGGPAGTDENSDIYLRTAGQLNIESNDTDTDNQYTALALRAGNANESNIVVEGALSDTSKQYISFGVRNQERMKIDREGNVTVGYASTSHKLDVAGSANVTTLNASNLVINTVSISVQYDLDQTLENGNVSTNVITVGKVSVTDPTLAQTASNLVTWNATTKEFEDSGGLISNKLAIVSEQPPAALTGATTTVDGHGKYIAASSTGTAYNAFDKSSTAWTSGATYNASTGAYDGAVDLGDAQTVSGEYVTIEFPYKTTLRHVTILPGGTTASFPGTAYIYGTNDNGTTWTSLRNWSGVTPSSTSDIQTFTVNAPTTYKKYALVVNATSAGSTTAQVGELRLFTETFTVDAGVVSTTAASGLDVGYTEHPVEPMTDYHTYVEGHGTYEASASSEFSGTAWKMFDHVTSGTLGSYGLVWSPSYNSDGTYTGSATTVDIGGTRYAGEWLQLKTPYAILLSHFKWFPVNNWEYRSPAQGLVLGSNDGENWYKLTSWSGETFTFNTGSQIDVNATTPYQHFRLVIEKTGTSDDFPSWRTSAYEWRLFAEKPVTRMENVHISGELSSETLQTGYIKWPKVPLKANESEGYVASASTEYPSGTSYYAWHAFEDKGEYSNDVGSFPAWCSHGGFVDGQATISRTTGTDTFNHEWLQIQMPSAICLSHFTFSRRHVAAEMPKSGRMYGSNDGISWTKLISFSNNTETNVRRIEVKSRTLYSYFRFAITEIQSGTNLACVDELQLFEAATGVGAAPTSAKLQVAGSLGMAKGAEFFAGDDVVMELPKHDRPLTKYPEVAMTANSSGGYVASANSTYPGGAYEPYSGFNNVYTTDGDGWEPVGGAQYSTSTGAWIGGTGGNTEMTLTSGTTIYGQWIQLQMPQKIKLSYANFAPKVVTGGTYDDLGIHRSPAEGYILGSNDGTSWTSLTNWSGYSSSSFIEGQFTRFNVNASVYYKYYRMVCTATVGGTYGDYFTVQELEYWGYEEGDTSVDVVHRSIPNKPGQQHLEVYWDANDSNSYSFADSSNVYDLSGSGVTGTITGTNGFDAEYNAWEFDGSGDYIQKTNINSKAGNWIHSMTTWIYFNEFVTSKVFSVNPPSYLYGGHNETSAFYARSSGFIWDFGMNNNNTTTLTPQKNKWYHIALVHDGTGYKKMYIDNVLQTSFSYSNNTNIVMQTGATLNIGEGNLNGKISNFRLFDKALSADQVRELYEYDAERFGHRQNVVALHKGNLGVGVAHPTSRFEVAGADGLQEYPPKAMSGHETYIDGHGVFRVITDNPSGSNAGFELWRAFDKSDVNGWTITGDFTSGVYTGSTSLGSHTGRPAILHMPYAITLKKIRIQPRNSVTSRFPADYKILGSNDNGSTWTLLATFVGKTYTDEYQDIDSDTPFSSYALVISKLNDASNGDRIILGEWRLFGTPAPSSLEDGHMTLGKALTLPRVSGHPAGAETPRAESLVVHYDTTVDSVVSGSTVVDISGNGINSNMENSLVYSSSSRALDFAGTNARTYLASGPNSSAGAWVHSVSFWFKATQSQGTMFFIGEKSTNKSVGVNFQANNVLRYYFYSNDIDSPTNAISLNTWTHGAFTYDGLTTKKMYINGELVATTPSGTQAALNLATANDEFLLGSQKGGTDSFNGSISNIKIWNVTLTAEEVAMEYALGRTGKSINLTDTALCLGGTVPRAQLDVRGSALFGGNVGIGTASPVALLNIQGLSQGAPPTSGGETISNGLFRIRDNYNVTLDVGTLGESPWSAWLQVADATNMGGEYPLVLNPNGGNVGIGTTNPAATLDVRGMGAFYSQVAPPSPGGAITDHAQKSIQIGNQGTATGSDFGLLQNSDNHLYFYYGLYSRGYINSGTNVGSIDFTGQHRNFIDGVSYANYDSLEGLIVSANKNKYYDIDENVTTGANAIQISQSLPLVSLSTKEKDKACFGVISGVEDPDTRKYEQGTFVTILQKQVGDRRAYINSVGEGAMWVTNINGSLESGDYITTSNVPGYGQKQDSEFLANYTVAKITMDCDFNPVTQPIQIIKKELANVNYWVKTTYSNVSLEEYSNLADENRTTEDETYYTKDVELKYTYKPTVTVTSEDPWDDVYIMPFATYAEWSNLEANVQNTYTLTYMQNDFDSTRYEKTTVSNVSGDDVWDTVDISPYISYDEWSNLEANVQNTFTITYMQSVTTTCTEEAFSNLTVEEQNTYTLVYTKTVTEEVSEPEGAEEHTRTIYKKVERNETKTEPTEDADEWVLDVRQELVNVLDEHGQLQWEDDPSGATEKAFKIRHLDASGAQTDEANAVHIAAFVGCTYHCG